MLPRDHVAELIYKHHRVWLTQTARSGVPHHDTTRRNISGARLADGEGAWERLLLPTTEVHLRLASFYDDIFREADDLGISFTPDRRAPPTPSRSSTSSSTGSKTG